MWGLWFVPLVLILFTLGTGTGIGALIVRRRQTGRWLDGRGLAMLAGAPMGCAALPIFAALTLVSLNAVRQASDADLYVEIFGEAPTMTEDQMLFDDFGTGPSRAIYLRAEPDARARARLLATPGLQRSAMTVAAFDALGQAHGFSWWHVSACPDAVLYAGNGHRDWRQLTLLDCPGTGEIYAAAAR